MAFIFLTIASGGGALVDIDGTFFIQLGTFFVMLIFLYAALFRPAIRMIEARRDATLGTKEKAQKMKKEAVSLSDDMEAKIANLRASATEERDEIVEAARREERELLAKAKEESHALVEKAREDMGASGSLVKAQLLKEAESMADIVASRILDRAL